MDNKIYKHIENSVDGFKWGIIINNNEVVFNAKFPDVSHMKTRKKEDLKILLEFFITDYIQPTFLIQALESFRYQVVTIETCLRIESFIKQKEDEIICLGGKSIKDELGSMIYHFSHIRLNTLESYNFSK